MTHTEFFNWLRQKSGGKLTQSQVDGANELLARLSADEAQMVLTKINQWADNGMKLSMQGLELIKQFEGFRSAPYRCPAGVWTIGYGNTYYADGTKVKSTDKPLTKKEASELKLAIINQDFAPAINNLLADEIKAGKISQPMFDALISLAYNIGLKGLSNSSVIRLLKSGNITAAADAFLRWNKSNGRVLTGLVNRRKQERELFLS